MSEEVVVEVPLSSEYITESGMYMAGYLWGRKIRSVESAPEDAPEVFLKGVEDGYGDGMRLNEEKLKKITSITTNSITTNNAVFDADFSELMDKLDEVIKLNDQLDKINEQYNDHPFRISVDDQRR